VTDRCSRRRNGCDGFTLIEVVIVITIMGVLAVAIAGVFSVIVRTTPSTEARADDARSLIGISTWLPADVSATPRTPLPNATDHWDSSPGRSSGCSGTDPGINLLRLQHRESISGAPQNFIASYRLVDDAESSRIVRVTCANGAAPAINNVSAGLPPSSQNPVTVTWKTATELGVEYVIGVEMEITTFEGDTLRVDASSRNPDQTLSTIPDAVTTTIDPNTTTTTAATTTTTTTTVSATTTDPSAPPTSNGPPTASAVSGTVDPGSTLTVTLAVSDPNDDPLTVTLNEVPDGWIATLPTGAVATPITIDLTPPANETNTTYVIDYTVTDPFGASASSTISVDVTRVPCTASFVSINPNPAANTASGNGNGNQVGPLERAVTVTVNKAGNCSELALRYTRVQNAGGNQASDDDRQPQIDLFGDSITVTFPATSTQRWQKGDRPIELVEFPGLPNEIVHQIQQLKVD
jgi:prepilin-type N-terminal cleavage/methylation domain-containing protein